MPLSLICLCKQKKFFQNKKKCFQNTPRNVLFPNKEIKITQLAEMFSFQSVRLNSRKYGISLIYQHLFAGFFKNICYRI